MSTNPPRAFRRVHLITLGVLSVVVLLALSPQTASAAEGKCEAPILVDQVCEAGKTVAQTAGDVATAPVRAAANGAVDMLTAWVADSAQWFLGKVVGFLDHSTSPDLGTAWFTERYRFMLGLGALVLVPMLLIASIRAVMNQDVSQLLRSFFVYLPAATLGTFVAVTLTQTLLAVTDAMSAAVADGIAGDTSEIFDAVGRTLGTAGPASPGVPSFAIFFGALFLILGAFLVWLELLVRSAAVTVSVFFMPLMLAGLVWPATSRWTRRLVETLVALILSKFVIVSVISLATAALSDPGGGGFGSVMGGAALMLMAAFSPVALLKLMPMMESSASSHLDGLGREPIQAFRPGGSANQALSIMRSKVAAGASPKVAPAGAGAGVAMSSGVGGMAAGKAALSSAKAPGEKLDRLGGAATSKRPKDPSGGDISMSGGPAATKKGARGRDGD